MPLELEPIRRLDPIADGPLLDEAWRWADDMPKWWQDCDAVFAAPSREVSDRRIHVGIFSEGKLVAVVHLDLFANRVYEAHMAVKRKTSVRLLVWPMVQIADQLFHYGARSIFIWLPTINSAIFRLCSAVGFCQDGVSMLKGATRNRPIEWQRFTIDHPK